VLTFALAALAPITVLVALGLAVVGDGAARSPLTDLAGGTVAPPDARGAQAAADREMALEGVDAFSIRFDDPPAAGIVFDLDSGEVLWRRNPLEQRAIASLTKVMTALVVAERTKPGEQVRITNTALRNVGSNVGVFKHGGRIRVDALMAGTLIPSGGDAAVALAVHVGKSRRAFVRLMNERARELGLRCTRFSSPDGYESANRSCAADLAALARIAMRQREISSIVRKPEAAPRAPVPGGRFYVYTTNPLLRSGYPGTIGLKTGFTRHAGLCLIGIVKRGRRTLGVVLLDSPDPGLQARALLDRAFKDG